MNFKSLTIFLEVIRSGSISAAARRLGVSQPAVSKHIQALEEELCCELLIRGPRGAQRLTPAGTLLEGFAVRVMQDQAYLLNRIRSAALSSVGTLEVAASTTPGHFLMPAFLFELRNRLPDLLIHLNIANTATVIERVMDGRADVGIIGSEAPSGLQSEPFARDEVVLAIPPDHPLAGHKMISVQVLAEHPLILREAGSGTRNTLERVLGLEAWASLCRRRVLELGSTHAVLDAVSQGIGLGFVSRMALEHGNIREVEMARIGGVDLTRWLVMIYRLDPNPAPFLEPFLKQVRQWREEIDQRLCSDSAPP